MFTCSFFKWHTLILICDQIQEVLKCLIKSRFFSGLLAQKPDQFRTLVNNPNIICLSTAFCHSDWIFSKLISYSEEAVTILREAIKIGKILELSKMQNQIFDNRGWASNFQNLLNFISVKDHNKHVYFCPFDLNYVWVW